MTKTKLKIMELLGDLVDKELKFGCYVNTQQYKHLGEMRLISKCPDIQGDWRVIGNKSSFYQNEKDFEILGQYGHHTFLRWFDENEGEEDRRFCFDILRDKLRIEIVLEWNDDPEGTPKTIESIEIDLTKPPMEYTEEQDKLLLDFMEKVGKKE